MVVHDYHRLVHLAPLNTARIESCQIPGEYIFEYIGYSYVGQDIDSTTVYLHEPEWHSYDEKVNQRTRVLVYLKEILGRAYCEQIFHPNGHLLRIDPSFRSCDADNIMRLEFVHNSNDTEAQLQYISSVVDYVCEAAMPDEITSVLARTIPYHCAIEFDVIHEKPLAVRLYYKHSHAVNAAFSGMTVSHQGIILSKKTYFNANQIDEASCPGMVLDEGLVPGYVAEKRTMEGIERKVYLFNAMWAAGRILSRNHNQ